MSGAAHLDDERLSDLIDGAGTDHDVAHIADCDQCRARLESWRYATKAVSTLPPASEERREAAIEAALSRVGDRTDEEDEVIDLDARRRRRHFGLAARLATAAAAVGLIAGVSSALVTSGGGGSTHPTSTAALPRVVALGDVNNSNELVAALKGTGGSTALGGTAGEGSGAAGASSEGLAQSGSAGGTAGTAIGSVTPAAAPAAKLSAPGQTPCSPPAKRYGSLTERATLVWKGPPAVTFVYSVSNRHTAVVESSATCKVLATVTY